MNRIVDFITWWCWRRWRIYCPSYDVTHLFEKDSQCSLFDSDEEFVGPCELDDRRSESKVIKMLWLPDKRKDE